MDKLHASIAETLATLTQATGHSIEALYTDGLIDHVVLDRDAAYAHGFLEGVAMTLGLTVLEMIGV